MMCRLAQEMVLAECLLWMAQCNLRAEVDPVVTCSNASQSGGGSTSPFQRTHWPVQTGSTKMGLIASSWFITFSKNFNQRSWASSATSVKILEASKNSRLLKSSK